MLPNFSDSEELKYELDPNVATSASDVVSRFTTFEESYQTLLAERDARPTREAYDTVVSDRDSKNTLSALWKKNGLSLDISNNNIVNDNDKTDTTTTNDDSSDFPNWMIFGSGALAIGLISALVLRKK